MSKLLSICIPSYNMEQYLHRCVDSMLVDEVLEQLEIIIVNDGSKDSTLAIANDYKQRYPQSVVVIDKPNGHYGSCINASLKIATLSRLPRASTSASSMPTTGWTARRCSSLSGNSTTWMWTASAPDTPNAVLASGIM